MKSSSTFFIFLIIFGAIAAWAVFSPEPNHKPAPDLSGPFPERQDSQETARQGPVELAQSSQEQAPVRSSGEPEYCTLTFHLTDKDLGDPVGNAALVLRQLERQTSEPLTYRSSTNGLGRATFEQIELGSYLVDILPEKHLSRHGLPLSLETSEPLNMAYQLTSGAVIRGRVTNRQGKATTHGFLVMTNPKTGEIRRAVPDESGFFRSPALETAVWALTWKENTQEDAVEGLFAEIAVVGGETREIQITTPSGSAPPGQPGAGLPPGIYVTR